MIDTITENSIVFSLLFRDKEGSERASNARGVNTPDTLTIKHQSATDSKYGVATQRHLLRIDRKDQDETTGKMYVTSAYVNIVVPELATTSQVGAVIATLRAIVANVDSGEEYLEQLIAGQQ